MFAGANRRLKFRPVDGTEVLARGKPTLWVPRGRYQFIVEEMEPRGRGSLLEAFEALKQRLLAEGLFESSRKRAIPTLPARVGLVTSPDGAALRDILKVLRRRHAGLDIVLAPVRVQGEGAAEEIAAGIEALGRLGGIDVMIVGRGGGSIEDLWAFNEERVARAIAASPIPVISAVGHETDVTIADFVADLRAATPSHAAELVVASREELASRLAAHAARLSGASRWILSEAAGWLDQLTRSRALSDYPSRLAERGQLLDDLSSRMVAVTEDKLDRSSAQQRELALRLAPRHLLEIVRRRQESVRSLERRCCAAIDAAVVGARARTEASTSLLRSLSPLNVLQRGYAICTDPSGRVVYRAADEVRAGDPVLVRLAQGALDCNVTASRPSQEESS
jgi:exodeoxyribonuclease VII large subunit